MTGDQSSAWRRLEPGTALVVLLIVALAVWWHNTVHLAPSLAWGGFSPTYFVAALFHPDWFQGNYPSGAEEFIKSAPMLIYPVAAHLGVPILPTMKAMIGLELALLIGAAAWATRQLWPQSSWTIAWLVALFLIAGRMFEGDLARWGHPHYAWVYNFTYAAIIVGVAAALTRRLVLSAVALGLAVTCHAPLGLAGAAFAIAALLMDWSRLDTRRALTGVLLFGAIGGGWFAYLAATSELGNTGIPKDLWIAITRISSVHWYPIDMALFWERHWERLFPFLSVTLLLALYLPDRDGMLRDRGRVAAAGFLVLLVPTAVGIFISAYVQEPLLVKLALHRASSVYLILAALFIVPGLWHDVIEGSYWRAAAASLALIAPFYVQYGIPIAFSSVLAAAAIAIDVRTRGWTARASVLAALLVAVAGLLAIYVSAGVAGDWQHQTYTGVSAVPHSEWLPLAGVLLLVLAFRRWPPIGAIILLLALGSLGVDWAKTNDRLRDREVLAKATDYMAVQQWAHDRTPVGSLFMPEPTHFYGWREFSLRPSFGNLREWIHNGWIYNSRAEVFNEGLRRLAALGFDIKDYINPTAGRPYTSHQRLVDDVSARYHSFGAADFERLRREFGIKYFVFDKSMGTARPPLTVVFENASFLVGKVD